MKKTIWNLVLAFVILLSNNLNAQAHYFATDVETKVLSLNNDNIQLVVTELDSNKRPSVYPIGTVLKGKFREYNFRRHFLRDEYMKIHFYEAQLPDGSNEKMDNDIKVKPRVFISLQNNLPAIGGITETVLNATVAVWSVGFPVGRGVKALVDGAYGIYNTPSKESKWKQGSKGFIKGALFPLPELFLKGEEVALHDKSYLWIQDADQDKKDLTAFVVKRKNIYLHRDKYYAAEAKPAPDYTRYLNEKNMKKYQAKLAKKGVSAKVNNKIIEVKNNLVQRLNLENRVSPSQRKALLANNVHKHWHQSWRKPKISYEA